MQEQFLSAHLSRFQKAKALCIAPGRVNIIGEHIDYNGGNVLPFAIGNHLLLAINPSTTPSEVYSEHFDQSKKLNNDPQSWTRFIWNACRVLQKNGYDVPNFQLSIGGNLSPGSGMSSSSALTCGFIKINSVQNDWNLTDDEIITFASKAENAQGLLGGIMDQTCIIKASENHALWINCENQRTENIPLVSDQYSWMIIDSGVHHSLVDSEYNDRRKQSVLGMAMVQQAYPEVKTFGDLELQHIQHIKGNHPLYAKRIEHFYSENQRTLSTIKCLTNNNWQDIGPMLYQSQESLKEDYEVSCEEIDFLIDLLKTNPQVKGGRMIGGGFGGVILAMTDQNAQKSIKESLATPYLEKYNLQLKAEKVFPSKGLQSYKLLL